MVCDFLKLTCDFLKVVCDILGVFGFLKVVCDSLTVSKINLEGDLCFHEVKM